MAVRLDSFNSMGKVLVLSCCEKEREVLSSDLHDKGKVDMVISVQEML